MDKSFLIFIAIGLGFLYLTVNFVGDIQEDDEKYRNKGYDQKHMYDKYQTVDSVGQEVLNLLGADAKTQIAAWNKTKLKDEYILLFPDFGSMKNFVNDRINGEALKTKLLTQINSVEDRFFSGSITADQAKQEFSSLK
ncbi:MAG: hypothetical protein J7J02_05635 [Sulfurovum sp.]|nr:hypothetical protein [Sulfurovum sp.]